MNMFNTSTGKQRGEAFFFFCVCVCFGVGVSRMYELDN